MTDYRTPNSVTPVVPTSHPQIGQLLDRVRVLQQAEIQTDHAFHGGMYCRTVYRKAGTLIIGKKHKCDHLYVLLEGTIEIVDAGGLPSRFTAPYVFFSKPGAQRVVYSLTDTRTMTVHRTDNTTVKDVEDEVVEPCNNSPYNVGNVLKTMKSEVTL